MNPITEFEQECRDRIVEQGKNDDFKAIANSFATEAMRSKYMYNFTSLGRPIIQFPQDMVAAQELIWEIKPDLVIETGIAHGGSLIQTALMLGALDLADAMETGEPLVPGESKRKVLGIDIDIRDHNREAIEAHPYASYIEMMQGSAIAEDMVENVRTYAKDFNRVMVFLDSMHSHDHVLGELQAYAELTSVGSYCVVFDTFVEDLPKGFFDDRPWDVGDNPKTAVHEWIKDRSDFEIDKSWDDRLLISVAPDGFLKRTA
ncbi:cephalosporin hydroxylase family protein [Ahrensia sp. R2A130]|uniref:cephalosporin hydroxylase family protein n=1 Tax=Ahrensia sp. R2A130 TaxID=744979 RepID=UPI0001E0CA4C|nr:cephalosporin hydroxylase family protein [Ahrensia sp. R2A130]EFL87638.1 cephalosporin hydroxylase [Ahrensia sp. R2A130]